MRLSRLFSTRRRKVVAALAALFVLASSAAIAAWIVSVNNPPARGKFASLQVVGVAPSAAPGASCLPNAACDGNLRLMNTSGTPLVLTGFTAGTGLPNVTINGGGGGCIPTDLNTRVAIPAKSGLTIAVPEGTTDITIPGLFAIGDVGTQCQGADFSLDYTEGFIVTVSTP